MDGVCSQEDRACLLLSHGEESGRDTDEVSEAPCPVWLKRKTSSSSQESRKTEGKKKGKNVKAGGRDRTRGGPGEKGKEDVLEP